MVGSSFALPNGRVQLERRRVMSQFIRILLRKETDLTEIVSGCGAIVWAGISASGDYAFMHVVPVAAVLPADALTILLQLVLALGGALQLLGVALDLPRLRRTCALSSAVTWGVIGALSGLRTGLWAPSGLTFVLAGACSLAYVKIGQPEPRRRAA